MPLSAANEPRRPVSANRFCEAPSLSAMQTTTRAASTLERTLLRMRFVSLTASAAHPGSAVMAKPTPRARALAVSRHDPTVPDGRRRAPAVERLRRALKVDDPATTTLPRVPSTSRGHQMTRVPATAFELRSLSRVCAPLTTYLLLRPTRRQIRFAPRFTRAHVCADRSYRPFRRMRSPRAREGFRQRQASLAGMCLLPPAH